MIFSSQIYSQFLNRLWNTFACWYLISSLNITLQFNSHKVQDSSHSSNLMIYLKSSCESNNCARVLNEKYTMFSNHIIKIFVLHYRPLELYCVSQMHILTNNKQRTSSRSKQPNPSYSFLFKVKRIIWQTFSLRPKHIVGTNNVYWFYCYENKF